MLVFGILLDISGGESSMYIIKLHNYCVCMAITVCNTCKHFNSIETNAYNSLTNTDQVYVLIMP